MAVTLTPRLGLPISSAPDDSRQNTRAKFNEILTKLENQVAIDTQGTASERPLEGVRGQFYYATDTGVLSRYSGTGWVHIYAPPAPWGPIGGVYTVGQGWNLSSREVRSVAPNLWALSMTFQRTAATLASFLVNPLPAFLRPPRPMAFPVVLQRPLASPEPDTTFTAALYPEGLLQVVTGNLSTVAQGDSLFVHTLVPVA